MGGFDYESDFNYERDAVSGLATWDQNLAAARDQLLASDHFALVITVDKSDRLTARLALRDADPAMTVEALRVVQQGIEGYIAQIEEANR